MTMLATLKDIGQDYEWYPTTRRMVDAIANILRHDRWTSILDIGAGDGRVLAWLAETQESANLYAIEKAMPLIAAQPEAVTPVGTEFFEQDLMALPVDIIFSNPPYSEFEAWVCRILDTGFAKQMFFVIPDRWKESKAILSSIKRRSGVATVIHHDHFQDAERSARAVVDVVRVSFPDRWNKAEDPFDLWFEENVTGFDEEADVTDPQASKDLARLHKMDSIVALVAAFNEDYDRLQMNYRTIFTMDGALLKELGVNKETIRKGMKVRLKGLKQTYWQALFTHLDVLTARLSTKTKKRFLDKIASHTTVAFTESNAYSIVLWAIKFANQYFDGQIVDLFRDLSTHDGVENYKSNQRTWAKDGWRYRAEEFSHYTLDYRIVRDGYQAMQQPGSWNTYEFPGGLHNSAHELMDDMIAVFGNLGFRVKAEASRSRKWAGGTWENFDGEDGTLLFQLKAYLNGNVHIRMAPKVVRALNIEAGRILGWVRTPEEVVTEMGYTAEDAKQYFGSNAKIGPGSMRKLLGS